MNCKVYLSGEIHSDWRQKIMQGAKDHGLAITFTSAVTDHEASDAAGDVLGENDNGFWRDHQSSKVNAIRTKNMISLLFALAINTNNGTPHLTQATAPLWASLILPCMLKILFIR